MFVILKAWTHHWPAEGIIWILSACFPLAGHAATSRAFARGFRSNMLQSLVCVILGTFLAVQPWWRTALAKDGPDECFSTLCRSCLKLEAKINEEPEQPGVLKLASCCLTCPLIVRKEGMGPKTTGSGTAYLLMKVPLGNATP